jgi:hypothetical protein
VHAACALTPSRRAGAARVRAQYFVSSGFAFVHADSSTDVCAVEAVPLEQLDHDAVKQARAQRSRRRAHVWPRQAGAARATPARGTPRCCCACCHTRSQALRLRLPCCAAALSPLASLLAAAAAPRACPFRTQRSRRAACVIADARAHPPLALRARLASLRGWLTTRRS